MQVRHRIALVPEVRVERDDAQSAARAHRVRAVVRADRLGSRRVAPPVRLDERCKMLVVPARLLAEAVREPRHGRKVGRRVVVVAERRDDRRIAHVPRKHVEHRLLRIQHEVA